MHPDRSTRRRRAARSASDEMRAVEHLLGRYAQAHSSARDDARRTRRIGVAEAVALMIELAVDDVFQGEWDGMRGWADRAIAV